MAVQLYIPGPSEAVPGSVVVAGGSLYAIGYDQNYQLFVLNASTGSFLWNFTMGNQSMIVKLPVIGEKIVYVTGSDNRIIALAAADGREVWNYPADQPLVISSEFGNGTVFAGSQSGRIYAWNATTGQMIWDQRIGNDKARSVLGDMPPQVKNGRIYWEVYGSDAGLYSLDAITGTIIWNFSSAGSRNSGNNIYFYPVSGDRIYATQVYDIIAINLTNGLPVRKYTNGQIYQPPVVMDGNAYTVDGNAENHVIISIDGNTGKQSWKFTPEKWNGHANYWLSPLVLSNHTLYFGTEHNGIYALNALNGKIRWNLQTGGHRIYHSPTLSGQVLYAGDDHGIIYAVNAVTGEKIWDHSIGRYLKGSPVADRAMVYTVREDNRIFALNASTGKELWNYSYGNTSYTLIEVDYGSGFAPESPSGSPAQSHEIPSPSSSVSCFLPIIGLLGVFIVTCIRR